jgi:molybdenum cofactor biosynthesis protein B
VAKIDASIPFRPLNIAVLTITDTRTRDNDTSGDLLEERITTSGHQLCHRRLISDDKTLIVNQLREWVDSGEVHVILTTGGTGITARDVTPEAVREVGNKEIVGFGELFRWLSFKHIGTSTIQSRALAVLAKTTLIFALPGSTGACRDAWDEILSLQLDIRHRPCNFAELFPRL